jgi:nucleoside phosphorylase
MPMELAPLARRLRLHRRSGIAGLSLRSGEVAGRSVVGAVIGIGPKLAAERVAAVLDAFDVDRVIVVGISGAPDGQTPIGTVIRPAAVVDGDSGVEYQPHPFGAGDDRDQRGTLWTSATLITDEARVTALRERGVVALDMETAAVARVCESRHVPWSVVRTISDRVSDGLVDEGVLDLTRADGGSDWRAVGKYLVRRPSRLWRLVRLARDSRRAAARAAEVAVADLDRS